MRVSTNGEEQIQSFNSQKQYYQDKISSNKEWVMVGIYADEGITGSKTNKRVLIPAEDEEDIDELQEPRRIKEMSFCE